MALLAELVSYISDMKIRIFLIFLGGGIFSFDVQNFTFPVLEIFRTGQQSVAPKLARLKKMQVDPIDSHTRTDMNLIEFLFLNMDFNFSASVPRSERLTLKMPDI